MSSSKLLAFMLIFFAVISIASLWSLYIFRFAPLIIVFSAVLSFIAMKKNLVEFPEITPIALAFCAFIALLSAYPYLFITPFVDASADPAAHISSLAIKETMPKTYGDFSGLEYRYQIGFPLLAKAFIDLLPFISSNTLVWFFGVIFAFISAILVYLLAKDFFPENSEKAGIIALALFIGSKIVFQNMYWGQYTFMMASVFFLATVLAFKNKSPLAFLFFPVIIAAHPGVAFYSIIFFAIWAVIFSEMKRVFFLVISGLLALPVFFISYIHFIANSGAEKTVPLASEFLISSALVFPPWIGLLIFVLAAVALAVILFRQKFSRLNLFFASVFILSSVLSISLSATGRLLGGRVIELSMFSGLFLSVWLMLELLETKKLKNFLPHLVAGIILVSLFLFFSSSQLSHLRSGSKINAEEIEFAYAFKNFDSKYKKTLFLVENQGKIAEVAQKIPFDVMEDWYLSYDPRISANGPNYPEIVRRHELAMKAREKECIECIKNADFDYVVSKQDFFSSELGLKKVFEFKSYLVFSKG